MVAVLILYSIMQGITLIQDVWKRPIDLKSSTDRHVFVTTVNPKKIPFECICIDNKVVSVKIRSALHIFKTMPLHCEGML